MVAHSAFRSSDLVRLLAGEAAELGVEAGDATAAIQQMLVATGPGRVGLGVDVEVQGGPFLPVGRAGLIAGAISHDHVDEVVVGMGVLFHLGSIRRKEAGN